MASEMQPEVISRDIIKPSSPNPNNHPKIHNLSFFDQICPRVYTPCLYFYSSKNGVTSRNKSSLLKKSLSIALSHYYPLAGKIKDSFTLDCNDDGVVFLEARMKCKLSLLLKNPQFEFLNLLLPDNLGYADSIAMGPIVVQVTYFACGGTSIGLCLCHEILDMQSIFTFFNDWASIAQNLDQKINPCFNIGSLYPPIDLPILKEKQQLVAPPTTPCVWRRFVFHGEKIAKLKTMVADRVPNPTRGEVVTAFLYKLAVKAAAKANSSGSIKPSVMNNAIGFRTMASPPLSQRNIGNIGWLFSVSIREDSEVELVCLVKKYRQSKAQLANSFANTSNKDELYSLLLNGLEWSTRHVGCEVYLCSNCCGFSAYQADFGWGKPLWFCLQNLKNQIALFSSREGKGIEALVSFEEKVMAVFEQDEELLSFCSLNPSVLDLESSL